MKLFGAIDLHSNNNVTVLIDERDEVVYRKRLPNDLTLIIEQLSPYQSTLEGIVVESTYNWYWLVDGLMEKEHRVHLANTAAIQQYEAKFPTLGNLRISPVSSMIVSARVCPIPLTVKR